MKIFKRIFSAIASIAVAAAPVLLVSSANATTTFDATAAGGGTGQTAGTDGNKVTITREVNKVSNNVTNTFGYTITADSGNPDNTETGIPTSASIVFNDVAPVSGTATATTQVSFAGANFNKPGDYKYKITETSSTDSTNYPIDSPHDWYIYVQVRNTLGANNVPTGDYTAVVLAQGTENTGTTKDDITFESDTNMTYIELSKTVTGNIADVNKYFKFEIEFNTAMAGKTITVTGAHSDDGSAAVTGSDTHTVGADGKVTIYLKHGQTVQIGQSSTGSTTVNEIPVGTTYTITESDNTDYKTYVDVPVANITSSTTESTTSGSKEAKAVPADATDTTAADTIAFNANNITSYVNNREADPLTGFFYNFWPYILLLVLGMIGIYIIRKTSKDKEEEVEQ